MNLVLRLLFKYRWNCKQGEKCAQTPHVSILLRPPPRRPREPSPSGLFLAARPASEDISVLRAWSRRRVHLSQPFQQHSNLSKMQSFSYREHSLLRRYSWTLMKVQEGQRDGRVQGVAGSMPWPHLVGLDRPALHVEVPHLHRQVVSGHHVPTAVAEFHVGHRRDYF